MSETSNAFSPAYLRYAVVILALANVINYMDRMILSVTLEAIKLEFALSDTQIGLLAGFAFAIFYGTIGIVIAHFADRHNRSRIIALSMLAWSAITILTGAAQNFWQLFLARIGVGVGEAGVIPTASALLADYFGPARRSAALAIFSAGATLGLMAGLGFGGWLADVYGWRWAFFIAGLPGVPLSILVWKTLREPPRGMSDSKVVAAPALPFREAVKVLFARKAYVHMVLGACFVNFILYGIVQWMPTLMIRKFGLDVAQVGFFFGIAVGLGAASGSILGGFLASKLVERDVRWLVRIPFLTSFFYVPIYELAIFSPSANIAFSLCFVVNVLGGMSYGPMLAVMQSVVPSTMRATAAAFYGFSASLIGTGGAPFVVGFMSDAFAPVMGTAEALETAMAIAVLIALVIPFHFRRSMQFFADDMNDRSHSQAAPAAVAS